MTIFSSRPLRQSSINQVVKKHPSLFGIPFLLLMVAASYGLTPFAQTRYDLHDQKVKHVRTQLFHSIKFIFLMKKFFFFIIFYRCQKSKSWIWIRIGRNSILERSISLRFFFFGFLSPFFHWLFLYSSFVAVKCHGWWGLGTKTHPTT